MSDYLNLMPKDILSIIISYLNDTIIELKGLQLILFNYDIYEIVCKNDYPFLMRYTSPSINWENIYREIFFRDKESNLLLLVLNQEVQIDSSGLLELYLSDCDFKKDEENIKKIIINSIRSPKHFQIVVWFLVSTPAMTNELKDTLFETLIYQGLINMAIYYLKFYTPSDSIFKKIYRDISNVNAGTRNTMYENKYFREKLGRYGDKLRGYVWTVEIGLNKLIIFNESEYKLDEKLFRISSNYDFIIDRNFNLIYKIVKKEYNESTYSYTVYIKELTPNDIKLGIDKGYFYSIPFSAQTEKGIN